MITVGTDTYLSIDEADEIISSTHKDELSGKWLALPNQDKEVHLRNATYRIDCLHFSGYKHKPNQPLQFPRGMSTDIPLKVKLATAEEALAATDTELLRRISMRQQGITSITLGSASESYSSSVADSYNCPLLSQTAYSYLRQYMVGSAVIV